MHEDAVNQASSYHSVKWCWVWHML